jgi:NAD(P)-dependent dehydrogenase (short-subunit alcohol dehydrogenase family)
MQRGGEERMTTIIMTGGTSGLGRVAAEQIRAERNVRLILAARDSGSAGADSLSCDLAKLSSTRSFADALVEKLAGGPVDALVLNAAAAFPNNKQRTADGYETTFAVNHLAHYLLLRLLAPHLASGATVVITTSNTHDPRTNPVSPPRHADGPTLAHPDSAAGRRERMAGFRAYSASKLCNVLTARAFATSAIAKERALRVIAYNPGFTPGTRLGRNAPAGLRIASRVVVPILNPIFRINTLEVSGRALADAALGRLTPPPGKFYASLVKREITWPEPSEIARTDEVMWKLWRDSAAMVGLPPDA